MKLLALVGMITMTIGAWAQVAGTTALDQLKLLMQFKGKWETQTAMLKADGPPETFPYSAEFSATADNHGLLMTETAAIPGMGKLMGTNVIGVSPYDRKVHWFSVDNFDVAHEHVGEFTDAKHFTMEHRGVQEGKIFVEVVKAEFSDPNTLMLRLETQLDGKQVTQISGTFKRSTTP